MSTTNDDTATDLKSRAEEVRSRLMRPLTVTAPTYAFVATGIVALALIVVALD